MNNCLHDKILDPVVISKHDFHHTPNTLYSPQPSMFYGNFSVSLSQMKTIPTKNQNSNFLTPYELHNMRGKKRKFAPTN